MSQKYTIKTVPIIRPQFRLEIEIDSSMFQLIMDENEIEEIQINNFLEYCESLNSPFKSWEEFLLHDEINYYENHQWKVRQLAIEKVEEIRQQCDRHAQDLIETLEDKIVARELDVQQLSYDRIITAQTEAEKQCREWIDSTIVMIQEQAVSTAQKYDKSIQERLQLAIQECEAKIQKNQVKLQSLKGEVKLPPFPSAPAQPRQQPETFNYTQPEQASETPDRSTLSRQWKRPRNAWGKNQKSA